MPYKDPKRRREVARAQRAATEIRFVCAKCGREFVAPDSSVGYRRGMRAFVRLGGRTVCEVCAAARFKRRYTLFGLDPDRIQGHY